MFVSGSASSTGSFGKVSIGTANNAGVLDIVSNASSNASNLPTLNIDQDNAGAKGIFIATDTTGQSAIQAEANSLTTGRIARFYSNSDSNSSRNLAEIINNHASANDTTCLYIDQNANAKGIYVDMGDQDYDFNHGSIFVTNNNASSDGPQFRGHQEASSGGAQPIFQATHTSTNNVTFQVLANGNAGIATNYISSSLEGVQVGQGASGSHGTVLISADNGLHHYLRFTNGGNAEQHYPSGIWYSPSGRMELRAASSATDSNAAQLVLAADGNVGIGDSSPTNHLVVRDAAGSCTI